MNSIVLLGRSTSSIELKQTQSGKPVATFSLAVKRPFTKDTTDFFTICAWDKQAEILSRYVGKGEQICIRGFLQTRSWTDQQGNKRYATEVLAHEVYFCEAKKDSEGKYTPEKENAVQSEFGASGGYMPDAYKPSVSDADFEPVDDSSLPF